MPHAMAPPRRTSTAGRPRRKKAAKVTTINTSIRASVPTIPASPAAATVTPLAGELGRDVFPTYAGPAGSPLERPAEPATADQECRPAVDVAAAAMPAGTHASRTPATIATAFLRRTGMGIHARRA